MCVCVGGGGGLSPDIFCGLQVDGPMTRDDIRGREWLITGILRQQVMSFPNDVFQMTCFL